MGGSSKEQLHLPPAPPSHCLGKKLITRAIYTLLPLAFLHFYFFPAPLLTNPPQQTPLLTSITTHSSSPQGGRRQENLVNPTTSPCDYSIGRWVRGDESAAAPLYNGTSCATIKDGQNCMAHGRPDTGYLLWRWQPRGCNLPGFDPAAFLRLVENRHLAFVGDSMARNQLESLLCLLSSSAAPELVHRHGDDNKFRRWRFPSHNATVSVYWSPFLVKGVEKSAGSGPDHNELYLDSVDERWASDAESMDVVVFSVGHWFLHPAVYYEKGGDVVLGCHYCPGLNHTEVGFYDVYRKAFKTTLKAAVDWHRDGDKYVVVTTFSPSHFDGEWDKAGACPRTEPYGEGEKALGGMEAEMRKVQLEEVAAAARTRRRGVRVEALDVTGMGLMRPDGHPGPYMYAYPFADGVPERVQNDCVHWCLPGPIDTWNEILLEMVRRWSSTAGDRRRRRRRPWV